MKYLKEGIIRPDTTAPGLNEAREKLKYYSMSKEERQAYDEHLSAVMIQNDVLDTAKLEGRIEGLAEGRAEGRAEGITEGLLQTARNLNSMGMPAEVIQKATGLSIEEIEKLM